jgi:hypothetical protein
MRGDFQPQISQISQIFKELWELIGGICRQILSEYKLCTNFFKISEISEISGSYFPLWGNQAAGHVKSF